LAALALIAVLSSFGGASSGQAQALAPMALSEVTSPAAQLSASQMAFANADDGWLAVSASVQYQATSAFEVLGTVDGGTRWSRQWAGEGSPLDLVDVGNRDAWLSFARSVTCSPHMSNARCQALNARGALLRTYDGGALWHQVWAGAEQLAQIVMTRPLRGLGILQGLPCPLPQKLGAPPPSCHGLVVATNDGGSHWWPVLHTNGPVLALARQDGTWLAVQNTVSLYGTKPASPPARLVVWASGDDGGHWAVRAAIAPDIIESYLGVDNEASLIVIGDKRLILSLVDRDACGHACGSASWVSTDAGRHWTALSLGPLPGHFCGPDGMPIWAAVPGQSGHGPAVYMAANPAVNVCAPPVTALERLSNGVWQQVHLWQLGFVTALDWPAASTGYVVVSRALARTTDGGRAWRQAWPAPVPSGPLALFPGGRVVGAEDASSGGAVLTSGDDGRTWSQEADLSGAVSAIAFSSPERGLLALEELFARRWVVVGTSDGGSHWSVLWSVPQQATGPGYEGISGLWISSENDGLMLTTTGTGPGNTAGVAPAELWVTADGGHLWRKVASVPTNVDWVSGALAFYRDAEGSWHGFVQGGGRTIMTTNTGRSWQVVPQVPMLAEAQYVSGTTLAGWQLGAGQLAWLWMSTDGGRHWAKHRLPPPGLQDVAGQGILQFSRHGAGLWVEGGELWVTSDFGHRWRQVHAT